MPVLTPRLTSPESEYESSAQQNGLLPVTPGWNRTTITLNANANRLYVVRYRADRAISIRNVSFVVSTASGANDACEVTLYSAGGKLLNSTGSTAGKLNATGLQTIAMPPTSIYPDSVFFVAFNAYAVNGAVLTACGFGNATPLFGATVPTVEYGNIDGQATPPATLAAIAVGTVSTLPLIAVKES